MKFYYYLTIGLVVTIFFNCSTTNKIAQGEITELTLKDDYKSWYKKSYNSYSIDTLTLNKIPTSFNNTNNSIEIFMGTWCSDSQRETPRIIKILKFLNFTNYKIYGLDTDKKSEKGIEVNKDITRVPTVIIYDNNDQEINRIIEYPVVTLEKDLLSILKTQGYVPNYTK